MYAYDAAGEMDNDSYATVLKSFVITFSLQVASVNNKKVSVLKHLVHAKEWGISPKRALNMICKSPKTWCSQSVAFILI